MNRTSIVNLMNRAGQTPAVLAAFLMFVPQVCFCAGNIPAGLVVIAIVFGAALAALILDCPEAAAPLIIASILSILLAIRVTDNKTRAFTAPSGYGSFMVEVTSSDLRLDGRRRIYGVLEDGTPIASVLPEDSPSCYPEDRVLLEGVLEQPSPATNPGEFDYREYLNNKGITRSLRVEKVRSLYSGTFISTVLSFAESLRLGFIKTVTSGMDPDAGALACALLFGDRSLLGEDLSRIFTLTGLNHLAAVSGTHFTGFLILFPYIMSLFGVKNRKIYGTIYVLLCLFIGFLTSWTESVTRAAFMNICSFFGRDSLSSMSIAAIVLMISDPYSPLSQGFLMSYAASLTLKFIVPGIRQGMVTGVMFLVKRSPWKKSCSRKFEIRVSKFMSLIAASCGCSLIFCLFSGSVEVRIGPLMVIINILATLMVSFICAFFVPSSVLILIWQLITGSSGIFNIPLSFMLNIFRTFIHRISGMSYLSFGISCRPYYLICAAVVCAILAILPRCFVRKVFFRITCLILCVSLGFYCADSLKYGGTRIVFIDVGQGDAALIMSGGKSALIDGGVADRGLDTLPSVLDHYNISKVDYAIMSHWDLDHVGGLLTLAAAGRADKLYSPFVSLDDQVGEVLANTLSLDYDRAGAFLEDKVIRILAKDSFVLSDSCRLDVVAPQNPRSGGNEDSAVILLDAMGTKVLFTGDIGIDTEESLIRSGVLCDIDILKVAHHGSRFSTGETFLSSVSAEHAVISVAAVNPYGHPAPGTLERLATAGCRAWLTSRFGAVTVDIGRSGYRISGFVPDTG